MADTKVSALTGFTPISTDLMYGVDDPGGTPVSGQHTYQVGATLFQTLFTNASLTAAGLVELATTAEMDTGTDTTRAMGVNEFAAADWGTKEFSMEIVASDTAVTTGNGTAGVLIPASFDGFDIVDVVAGVYSKGVTGTTDVVVRRSRAGSDVDVLSTAITIGDEWFASDGVIDTANDDLATGDLIFFDVDAVHSGTAPNGLTVAVLARKP